MKVVGIASTYVTEKLTDADAVVQQLAQIRVTPNGAGTLVTEIL